MTKNISLTTEEIELIYSALLVYGDKLCEANKLRLDYETENGIANRAKKAYNTARKIIESKTETKATERNFTYEEGYEDGIASGIEEIKDEIRKLESNGIESTEIVNMIKAYNS